MTKEEIIRLVWEKEYILKVIPFNKHHENFLNRCFPKRIIDFDMSYFYYWKDEDYTQDYDCSDGPMSVSNKFIDLEKELNWSLNINLNLI